MVDGVKKFCTRVTSAKKQTGSMHMYMCVENLKRHQQSSTQVLHVRSEVWHTMHIDVDLIGPLPQQPGAPAIRVFALVSVTLFDVARF